MPERFMCFGPPLPGQTWVEASAAVRNSREAQRYRAVEECRIMSEFIMNVGSSAQSS